MAFSIDAAVEGLKVLEAPSKWVHPTIFAFQRDGRLHLVGREAVAVIDYGIACSPRPDHRDATLDLYAEDNHQDLDVGLMDANGRIPKTERKYFDHLNFRRGFESVHFTDLKELFQIHGAYWNSFGPTGTDGRIRMADYGYRDDCEAGDIAKPSAARVMVLREYFDLMRGAEARMRENPKAQNMDQLNLPGVAFVTPYAVISFPFPAELAFESGRVYAKNGWNMNTSLESHIVNFNKTLDLKKFDSSPHRVHFLLNGIAFEPHKNQPFDREDVHKRINNLIGLPTPKMQEVVDETNRIHNQVYAEGIARFEEPATLDDRS